MPTGRGRSGINATSYLGVGAVTPPQLFIMKRQPTINDLVEYDLGDLWVMTDPQEVWILTSKSGYTANWVQLYPGAGGGASNFPCDVDTASEAGGVLEIKGMPLKNINTKGTGNLVEVALNDDVTITGALNARAVNATESIFAENNVTCHGFVIGDIGVASGTDLQAQTGIQVFGFGAGVVQTDATGSFKSDNGTNGQVLIGGGSAPQWRHLTAGANITINEAPNSITISSTGGGGGGGSGCSFLMLQNSASVTYANIPSEYHKLGDQVEPLSIIFDTASACYPGDGLGNEAYFQAPWDGKFQFDISLYIGPHGASPISPFLVTPSRTYKLLQDRTSNKFILSTIVELSKNDKCYILWHDIDPSVVVSYEPWSTVGIAPFDYYLTYFSGSSVDSSTSGPQAFYAVQSADAGMYCVGTPGPTDAIGSKGSALSVLYDTTGGFYPGDGAGTGCSFTVPTSGIYEFTMAISTYKTTARDGGVPRLFFKSSSVEYSYQSSGVYGSSLPQSTECTFLADLAAGDTCTFHLVASTSSGDGVKIGGYFSHTTGNGYQSWISGKLIK